MYFPHFIPNHPFFIKKRKIDWLKQIFLKTADRTLANRKHSRAGAETNLDTFLLIFSKYKCRISQVKTNIMAYYLQESLCVPFGVAFLSWQQLWQSGIKPTQMFYIGRHFLLRKAAVTGQPFLVKVHLSSVPFSTPFPQPRTMFLETAKLPPKVWFNTNGPNGPLKQFNVQSKWALRLLFKSGACFSKAPKTFGSMKPFLIVCILKTKKCIGIKLRTKGKLCSF